MRTLAIAAVQTSPQSGDVTATWKKFVDQVHGIRSTFPDVQLVVFPELYLAAVDELLDETHDHAEQVAVTVPGELTERQAMADRHGRKIAGEPNAAGVENRPFDDVARYGIRPVEHDDRLADARGCAHCIDHCPNVGPGACADVLQVEDERVESAEHAVGRCHRLLAIQRVDWQSALRISFTGDVRSVLRSAKPVFRGEELNEIDAGVAGPLLSEQIDVGVSLFVEARLVGKKTDALSANQM